MSAFVNQKDGYGWILNNSVGVASDIRGILYHSTTGSPGATDYMEKVIFVDFATFEPQRIDKIFRMGLYPTQTFTQSGDVIRSFKVNTTGLLNDNLLDTLFSVEIANGFEHVYNRLSYSFDIYITGYAISDVTFRIHTIEDDANLSTLTQYTNWHLYPMFEAGP